MRAIQVRRPAAAGIALAVATAALVVGPGPAAEAGPGLVRVSASSGADSSPGKSAIATCPAGTRVIGGGGLVPNGTSPIPHGEVFITGLRPVVSPFGTGFRASASEDETGFAGDWSVTSVALCARAPAGLAYRWSTSERSSAGSRLAGVACPKGTKVISAGGVVNGGGQQVVLKSAYPSTDTNVIAQANEDETGYAASWSLTGWAICADPLPGWERVVDVGSHAPGSVLAECPRPKRVHGVGAVVTFGAGQTRLSSAFPVLPVELESVLVSAHEDETGYGQRWQMAAIAICAY